MKKALVIAGGGSKGPLQEEWTNSHPSTHFD